MAAVQFVDVHVADEIEVAVHQRGVRLDLVDGVVHVEHGADGGAVDSSTMATASARVCTTSDCAGGQGLHQHGDAAVFSACGATAARPSTKLRVACARVRPPVVRCWASRTPARRPGRDRRTDRSGRGCGPNCGGAGPIGAGDVQAFGADHQPVQSDENQAFGGYDVAVWGAVEAVTSAGVWASVKGAISIPVYPAWRMALRRRRTATCRRPRYRWNGGTA